MDKTSSKYGNTKTTIDNSCCVSGKRSIANYTLASRQVEQAVLQLVKFFFVEFHKYTLCSLFPTVFEHIF